MHVQHAFDVAVANGVIQLFDKCFQFFKVCLWQIYLAFTGVSELIEIPIKKVAELVICHKFLDSSIACFMRQSAAFGQSSQDFMFKTSQQSAALNIATPTSVFMISCFVMTGTPPLFDLWQ
jgi:hypothetical protein